MYSKYDIILTLLSVLHRVKCHTLEELKWFGSQHVEPT